MCCQVKHYQFIKWGVFSLRELLTPRWKKLISLCYFWVEGIDALTSLKTDLGHKTVYCGPQEPKSDQKSIGQGVGIYEPLCVSQPLVSELRNSKLKLDKG